MGHTKNPNSFLLDLDLLLLDAIPHLASHVLDAKRGRLKLGQEGQIELTRCFGVNLLMRYLGFQFE